MTQEQEATPSFTIEKLYVKDLSLEVPNAPEIFLDQESPEISVQLQTGIQPLNDEAFEVTLTVTVLEPAPSISRGGAAGAQRGGRRPAANRRPAEELNVLIEDMIQLLDAGVQPELRTGRYPDRKASEQIAKVLREIARELDA